MKKLIAALFVPFIALASGALNAADVYLQLQRGQKVVIALPDFIAKDASPETLSASKDILETTKNDILFTHLFNLSESGLAMTEGKIDFEAWSKGSDLLIKGTVSQSEGNISFTAAVFELPGGNPVFQKLYRTPARNARRIGHEFVADFIYRFTGNRGISASRIVFSNDNTKSKELYIIDYDGKNLRKLTSDNSINILPRWAPLGAGEILYTTFKNGNPDLALYTLATGKSRMISTRRGLNTSASFSPDGKTIVATLSFEGNSSLYLLDRDGKIIRRLTKSKSEDTSASFSADGRKIIFVSGRSGSPQIYMMNADGTGVEKLTDGGWCDSPVWSPAGDKIAYSRGDTQGHHDIIIQDIASGKTIQVTSDSGKNENPAFSPDGRFVAFTSTREGKRRLYIASLDGTVQKKLTEIPGSSATPTWEP